MNERESPAGGASSVAEAVRAFYEQHPYPPPIDNLDKYAAWRDPAKRRAEFHLLWPRKAYREAQTILVAGCGTSQAAKHAMRWPSALVTGIDFSETSVRSTLELKRKYRLDNLEVRQLPLERARELGASFDQVVCTGVLHHLEDPDAGLAVLRDVLAPEGALNIMVYAPYGRAGIYMMQDFCKRLGLGATPSEIRDLIEALKALPPGHPMQTLLREAPDFRNEAALADALLHPLDRAYSVTQVLDFLERGGLAFSRWTRQAAYSPRCGALMQIPQASRMRGLATRDQFVAAELFRGTMLRHSVIAHRSDVARDAPPIGFDGDDWQNYVPVRMPDTVCIRERLPPGAAAVLVSQSHTYRDIYLPIDATELGWLEAIDGVRTAGVIAGQTPASSGAAPAPEAARAFFERLWWHDQVVFDASPA